MGERGVKGSILNSLQGGLITLLVMWADNFQLRWRELGWLVLCVAILGIRDELNKQRIIPEWLAEHKNNGKVREAVLTDHAI